ncbi:MAG: septal ring lytic transglycosylase RlpA family protein [Chitinophagaceae bacterium]
MYIKKSIILIIFLLDSLLSIAQTNTSRIALPDTSAVIFKDSLTIKNPKIVHGIASFYSKNLEGSKTATGETFFHVRLTAASNNFALNTWVRITNLRNNKSVIVRINDRMNKEMAKKGRVIDVSKYAAEKLNFIRRGLAKVKVEEVYKGTIN